MEDKKNYDLSILLCCLNEIERLPSSLKQVIQEFNKLDIAYEILIIDNGSTDGTREYLNNLNYKNIKLIWNDDNLGKGGSVKKGIASSSGKYCAIFDPDLEYYAHDLAKCYKKIIKEDLDFVLGSRRKNNQKIYIYFLNYAGVAFVALLTNLLYGSNLTDTATAIKVFKKSFIDQIKLSRNSFNLDFELVCRTLRFGGKIAEEQISYSPRSIDEGKKIHLIKDGAQAIFTVLVDRIIPLSKMKKYNKKI